ncbi:transmembrane protein, putative (macronuclear) [Tetrahymena thermophila SB210]|uniref:Transmembrane protein, putative n=1 Tax=Tetrahymena thermophila (strain SB210) TaxID=312017 RepID=W7X6J2_TETTS|nr:transmembrane protein, putative [Tetrahymena thermophila SB210]EWS71983.1 transmembrane protein, putative [Tetrahymena thermophila SB210]|eukprot:XP_012655483.1 transmembrane protein, putative [Tetrahymena thermophila SB210]
MKFQVPEKPFTPGEILLGLLRPKFIGGIIFGIMLGLGGIIFGIMLGLGGIIFGCIILGFGGIILGFILFQLRLPILLKFGFILLLLLAFKGIFIKFCIFQKLLYGTPFPFILMLVLIFYFFLFYFFQDTKIRFFNNFLIIFINIKISIMFLISHYISFVKYSNSFIIIQYKIFLFQQNINILLETSYFPNRNYKKYKKGNQFSINTSESFSKIIKQNFLYKNQKKKLNFSQTKQLDGKYYNMKKKNPN